MTNATVTSDNGVKLKGQRRNTIGGKSSFTVRNVDHWNKLPASVVSSNPIVTPIETDLKRGFFTAKGIGDSNPCQDDQEDFES